MTRLNDYDVYQALKNTPMRERDRNALVWMAVWEARRRARRDRIAKWVAITLLALLLPVLFVLATQ
jgi:hypothetical protein